MSEAEENKIWIVLRSLPSQVLYYLSIDFEIN